ncbi:MAG: tail fiber protein [Pseudomonadota bacterium]
MTDFYIGQIVLTAFAREMKDWKICDGKLLLIQDYPELFDVIGTIYGGDGENSFALPDLSGRVPISFGQGNYLGASSFWIGESFGSEAVKLNVNQLPPHNHQIVASSDQANSRQFSEHSVFAACIQNSSFHYIPTIPSVINFANLSARSVLSSGENKEHNNLMPTIALCYQICISGIYNLQSEET